MALGLRLVYENRLQSGVAVSHHLNFCNILCKVLLVLPLRYHTLGTSLGMDDVTDMYVYNT